MGKHKKSLSLFLVFALCVGVASSAIATESGDTAPGGPPAYEAPSIPVEPSTPEEPSPWATELVYAAIEAGLVPESFQSNYNQTTTRLEFAALAVLLYETVTGLEIRTNRSMPFTDTTDMNAIKAAEIGVTKGTGDGTTFSPDLELTREQAATMLSRLAEALEKSLPEEEATFADVDSVSEYAVEAVGQMQATGIMQGFEDNTFAPRSPYTRQQSIMTIMRLFNVLEQDEEPTPDEEAAQG